MRIFDVITKEHGEIGDFMDRVNLLEIGFGKKRELAKNLKEMGFNGRYIGIDIDKTAIGRARRAMSDEMNFDFIHLDAYNSVYNIDGLEAADEVRIPIPENFFDVIVVRAFRHMYPGDSSAYLKKVAPSLVIGGRVYIEGFIMGSTAKGACQSGQIRKGLKNVPTRETGTGHSWVSAGRAYEESVGMDEFYLGRIGYEAGLGLLDIERGNWFRESESDAPGFHDIAKMIKRKSEDA